MTSYPAAIPALPRPGAATTMDAPGYTGSGVIDGISDEIEAIATELGTTPRGASASVKARLDAVDTALAGKETAGAAAAAYAAAVAASQPLDSDLTAIAALTTTTFGRSLLALADAAAGRTALGLGTAATQAATAFEVAGAAAAAQAASQPLDSDLTAIAALTTTSYGRAFLALADAAAARTALALGGSATLNVGTATGTVAAGDDSRMTNSRTPTAHASSHLDNGSDPIATFTSARSGAVPASGGGTSNFLRADGTWAAASGGSSTGIWTSSAGLPADSTGNVGDFYEDTTTFFGGVRHFGPKITPVSVNVSLREKTGTLALITTSSAHGLAVGQPVTLAGVDAKYNGTWLVTAIPTTTTFRVTVTNSVTEASTASTGTAARAWPVYRADRSIPPFAADNNAYTTQFSGGWLWTPSGTPGSGTVIPPWSIAGTAAYIEHKSTSGQYGAASATGEAYALLELGSQGTSSFSFQVDTVPSEAGGKAGIVVAGSIGSSQFGIEIHVRNDNKLYIDRNVFGTVTNLWTSTTTATSGSVFIARFGGAVLVVASTWTCDQRVETGSIIAGGSAAGLFFKNTSVGRISGVRIGA